MPGLSQNGLVGFSELGQGGDGTGKSDIHSDFFSYSCGQTNTTTLISCDREFSGTNRLQIRIQLVKIRQKTYLRSFSHDVLGWPNFLGHFSQRYPPLLRGLGAKLFVPNHVVNGTCCLQARLLFFGNFLGDQLLPLMDIHREIKVQHSTLSRNCLQCL